MKIQVKAKHIKKGIRCCPDKCPIALALKEKTKKSACVAGRKLGYGEKVFYSPKKVIDFINNFDCGDEVKPMTFELTKHDLI